MRMSLVWQVLTTYWNFDDDEDEEEKSEDHQYLAEAFIQSDSQVARIMQVHQTLNNASATTS